nr:Eco57I restriction-modification methylase domain-containing protein [Enterococcus durans]
MDKVRQAIGDPSQNKTITLTVRKLTTGVNIPEWTAVLFLSNTNSAMNYLQAAFRAQTPFSHEKLGMKKNCYIFDFAPDRALTVMAESAQINSGVGKKNTLQQKEAMTQLLNFMPILGQTDHGMKVFNVDRMLTQLKKVYAEKAVRSGFEDDSLYNDELLTLDEADLNDFNNLKEIVGKTNLSGLPKKVEINVNGLTDEEYKKGEKAQKKKPRERITEEKEIIEKVKQAKKQRKAMISILRGISIRIPMMIYGMPIEVDKEMGIDEFVNHVDSISWEEFMPKGIKKSDFKRFAKYYDPEYTERAEKIAELFGTFKNPDKETVLTSWRVVNLQLSKTIGGLRYFDENFENTTSNGQDSITWVDTEIAKEVFKPNTKILEINSKTGLYPLYVASSLFHQKRNKLNDDRAGRFSKIDDDEIIQEVLKENIYVIAKTPMAKTITRRTLAGYNDWTTNILYVEEIDQKLKSNMDQTLNEIQKGLNVMKFDVVIGNPPHQEKSIGDSTQKPPIYHKFMELAYTISDKAVLITPARFLFNAGATPEDWNHKMINDNHLKIVYFENVSYNIFPNTNFGSIVVTYWDKNKNFEPIGIMTNFSELNLIIKKLKINGIDTLDSIISGRGVYKLTQTAHNEHPEIEDIQSRGHKNDVGTGVFGKLENIIFFKDKPNDGRKYTKVLGLLDKNREYFWVDTRYITHTPDYTKFKVVLPKANGTGLLKDKPSKMIGVPLVLEPFVAFTETFISIGAFDNEEEAHNALKYIKSKFARALLGVLKVTQDNPRDKWKFVPLQEFNSNSDINWAKSIPEIDQQLYTKYKLSQDDIDFIEGKVRQMD